MTGLPLRPIPGFFERVPKGARFNLGIVINVFSNDANGGKFLAYILDSLKLVQDDYLGGSGSRGNGQVRFEIKSIAERPVDYYTGEKEETNLDHLIPEAFKSKGNA